MLSTPDSVRPSRNAIPLPAVDVTARRVTVRAKQEERPPAVAGQHPPHDAQNSSARFSSTRSEKPPCANRTTSMILPSCMSSFHTNRYGILRGSSRLLRTSEAGITGMFSQLSLAQKPRKWPFHPRPCRGKLLTQFVSAQDTDIKRHRDRAAEKAPHET